MRESKDLSIIDCQRIIYAVASECKKLGGGGGSRGSMGASPCVEEEAKRLQSKGKSLHFLLTNKTPKVFTSELTGKTNKQTNKNNTNKNHILTWSTLCKEMQDIYFFE